MAQCHVTEDLGTSRSGTNIDSAGEEETKNSTSAFRYMYM